MSTIISKLCIWCAVITWLGSGIIPRVSGTKRPKAISDNNGSTSSPSTSTSTEIYEVEAILGKRGSKGKKRYLVKWKGFSTEEATWEKEKDIFCKELISDFEAQTTKMKVSPKTNGSESYTISSHDCDVNQVETMKKDSKDQINVIISMYRWLVIFGFLFE